MSVHPYRTHADALEDLDDQQDAVELAHLHWQEASNIRCSLQASLLFWMAFLLVKSTRGIAVAAVITLLCTRFEEWRRWKHWQRLSSEHAGRLDQPPS